MMPLKDPIAKRLYDRMHNRRKRMDPAVRAAGTARRRASLRTEAGRAIHRAAAARYYRRHPEKIKARRAVKDAIRTGRLTRLPCRVCGGNAEAHHPDYSKPLLVDWLCKKHHEEAEHTTCPIL